MKHSFTYFRTLLLLAAMVLGAHVNVWGWTWTGETIVANTECYLYNIGADMFAQNTARNNTETLINADNVTQKWKFSSDGGRTYIYKSEHNGSTGITVSSSNFLVNEKTNWYREGDVAGYMFANSNYYIYSDGTKLNTSNKSGTYSGKNTWLYISTDQMSIYKNRNLTFTANIPNKTSLEAGASSADVILTKNTAELSNYADRNKTKSTATFTASPDEANGWSFEGWYSDEEFTQLVSTERLYSVDLKYNKTTVVLYAKFKQGAVPTVFSQNITSFVAGKVYQNVITSNNTATLSLSSNNESIAKFVGSTLYVYQAGDFTITVHQDAVENKYEEGNANFVCTAAAPATCWTPEAKAAGNYYLLNSKYNAQNNFLKATSEITTNSAEATLFTFSGTSSTTISYTEGETTKYITQNKGGQTWGTSSASWSIVEASADDINNLGQGSGWKFANKNGDNYDRHLSINNEGGVNYIRENWSTNFYVWNYISEAQMQAHIAYTTLTDYVGTKTVSAVLKDVAVDTLSANDCESATEYDAKATNLQAVIDAYDAYADIKDYIEKSSAPAEKIAEATAALAVSTTASEIRDIKSMLKREPDFAYNGGTLKVDATSSFVLTNVDVETLEVAITNNTPAGLTDGSEHADEIIAYDKATNTIYAYNAGTAHIVLRQPETDALYADEAEFDITVEKHTNTITLDGTTNYNVTLSYNDSKTLTLASDNAAVAIAAEQTSGTDEVAFAGDALTVTSNYRDGAAAIAVSQAEDYKYAAAAATINVAVAAGTEEACLLLSDDYEKIDINGHREYALNGIGDKLTLSVGIDALSNGGVTISYSTNNRESWNEIENFYPANNPSSTPKEYYLSEDATDIQIKHPGSMAIYVHDLKVTRKNFVRADKSELVTPVALVNQPVVATFDLQYSTTEGDDILLVSENPKFVLSQNHVSTAACSQGVETITVTYTSDEASTDNGNIIIYNHSHRFVLPVSGTTRPKLQTHFVYTGEDSYNENSVYDALGNLKGIEDPFQVYDENGDLVEHAEIVMTSANEDILEVSNNMLVPYCGGHVNLTATYAGDDTYAAAEPLTKDIYVAECEADIDWDQIFRAFTSPDDLNREVVLTPVLRDKDGNNLNATFSFTTGNAEVATIINNNTLHMVGNGKTTVTAATTTTYTDSKGRIYATASLDKEVRMRQYDAPCESELYSWSGNMKAEASTYAEWTWANPTGDLIDTDRNASFTASISFWATRGTFKTYQQVEGEWADVTNSGRPGQNTTGIVTCRLAANATGFRVEYSGTGWGSCIVYDLNVPMKTYMTADKTAIEASKDVNKTYLSEITVRYSDIPTIKAEVTDLNVIKGGTGSLSIEATEEVKNDCGKHGSYTYRLSGTFSKEGEVTANVHFYTDADATGIVIPVTLTITEPDIYEPGCTDCDIIWDGSSRPNFEDEVHLSDNVNVTVNGDVTVKGLTIDEGSSVTITVNGHLTIEDAPSVEQDAYGDLIIEKGGWVTINGTGTTQVRNLAFNTALGNRFTAAQSAQLELARDEYLNVNGDMYIDITFDPRSASELTPEAFFGSYDFTVPFPVDAANGIFYVDAEGHETALRFGVDYLIASFSESGRAKNQKCWINYSGILQPSVGYTITIDSDHPEWNTLRFRKVAGAALNHETQLNLVQSSEGTPTDHGWNCIGNGTPMHAFVQAAYSGDAPYVQVYDHKENKYIPIERHLYNFVVGSSFFIQAETNNSTLTFEKAHTGIDKYLAPQRSASANTFSMAQIQIREADESTMADQLFVSADNNALNTYEIGRDMLKLGDMGKAKSVQIWGNAYGHQLAAINLPLVGNQATFPISIYAPKAGQYTLEQAEASEDYDVYLLYQGRLVWNLNMSAYTTTLPQGASADYSILLLRKQPAMPTDLSEQGAENCGARKIFVGGKTYIEQNGMIFDALGKKL